MFNYLVYYLHMTSITHAVTRSCLVLCFFKNLVSLKDLFPLLHTIGMVFLSLP